MKRTFHLACRMILCALPLAAMTFASNANAQSATVAVLFAGVDEAKKALQDIIVDAGVQGQVVTGSAQSALDGAVADLRRLINNDVSLQISSLTGTAAMLAQQIQNTVSDLDRLIQIRSQCAFEGVDRLLYGIKTITSQLQNAIPLVKSAQPFLYTFMFDGHSPGIVPREGGRATVRGFSVWQGVDPLVDLVDENRHLLMHLSPSRAADSNSLSVVVPAEAIQTASGKCLAVSVTPRATTGFLFFHGTKELPAMYLPICVPATINAKFQFVSTATFTCPAESDEVRLDPHILDCWNDSCEHTAACHAQYSWPVPNNCRIVRFDKQDGGNKYNNNTVVERIASANTITADGGLDTAQCACAPFVGCKRLHHTQYDKIIAPYMRCDVNSYPALSQATSILSVSTDAVPACVTMARPCNESASSYRLDVKVGFADDALQQVLSLPTVTTALTSMPFQSTDYVGMHIQGSVNPRSGANTEVCATLQVRQCGY